MGRIGGYRKRTSSMRPMPSTLRRRFAPNCSPLPSTSRKDRRSRARVHRPPALLIDVARKESPRRHLGPPPSVDKSVLTHPELRRIRDRDHVRFVAQQTCLVCGRRPCDAHHLRFAQGRALSRKVSDEFTVPLCRGHHRGFIVTAMKPGGGKSLGSIQRAPRERSVAHDAPATGDLEPQATALTSGKIGDVLLEMPHRIGDNEWMARKAKSGSRENRPLLRPRGTPHEPQRTRQTLGDFQTAAVSSRKRLDPVAARSPKAVCQPARLFA